VSVCILEDDGVQFSDREYKAEDHESCARPGRTCANSELFEVAMLTSFTIASEADATEGDERLDESSPIGNGSPCGRASLAPRGGILWT